LERPAKLAAPGFLAQIRQIELGQCPEQAYMHGTDLAHVNGIKLDTGELALVMEIGNIGELAAEPIKGLDDDDVENAPIKSNSRR
jgi:hypothetical protein